MNDDKRYPHGKVSPNDLGETPLAIDVDFKNNVISIEFLQPTKWIGFNLESAIQLRDGLNAKIQELVQQNN
jgi:hypothetical protein